MLEPVQLPAIMMVLKKVKQKLEMHIRYEYVLRWVKSEEEEVICLLNCKMGNMSQNTF